MAVDRKGRLARWSRRKRSGQDVKIAPPDAAASPAEMEGRTAALTTPPADADATPPTDAGAVEPPGTGELDLPSIDSLTADSDYAPFLREGVPQYLARAALRKLWLSDPVLANLDGLNDYDEDYSIIQPIASALNASSPTEQDPADDPKTEARDEDASPSDAATENEVEEGATTAEGETEPEETENKPIEDDEGNDASSQG